jgi:hypothetical protein
VNGAKIQHIPIQALLGKGREGIQSSYPQRDYHLGSSSKHDSTALGIWNDVMISVSDLLGTGNRRSNTVNVVTKTD